MRPFARGLVDSIVKSAVKIFEFTGKFFDVTVFRFFDFHVDFAKGIFDLVI